MAVIREFSARGRKLVVNCLSSQISNQSFLSQIFFWPRGSGAVKIVSGKKFIMSNWGSKMVAIFWLTKVWFVGRRGNFPVGWLASISNRQNKIFQEGRNG